MNAYIYGEVDAVLEEIEEIKKDRGFTEEYAYKIYSAALLRATWGAVSSIDWNTSSEENR